MKKQFIRVLSLVLAMAMLLSLSACGGNTGTTGHVHTFSKWEVTAEPSCATFGMQKRICDDCGFTEFLQIPTLEHTAVVDEALAATCTLDGRTEGSHCSVCKQVIVEQQAIPATGHAFVENAAVKETCTLDGKTEGSYCSICQLVIAEQTVIPATGHTLVVDAAVEPTCTLPGRTEGSHCGICKLVIVEQRAVPAPGHDWADASDTAPKTCRTCGVTEGTAQEKPEEPTPTEPQPTEPEPTEPVDPISPLGVVRVFAEIQAQDGIQPFVEPWDLGKNVTADLSGNLALAYSLSFSSDTKFEILPDGYDPNALLEWGKYPGLNIDILHKYGFTGKGAVIAYVDGPIPEHEAYANVDLHYESIASIEKTFHGSTVLSMLAGEEVGTAPDARVYFYANYCQNNDVADIATSIYMLIEQNKLLPEDEKITMVGFSNNLNLGRTNEQAFIDAVAACEEAGIMVWFCGEYLGASFIPMADKNNPANVIRDCLYGNGTDPLVHVPAAGRTSAGEVSSSEYMYWGSGGLSWTMPYMLGLYAIATEIDPTLTQDEIRALVAETAYDTNGMKLVNPVGFIAAVLERVGRGAEGQAMLDEVSARQKYIYAIMDTAAMSEEDLNAVGSYLASITDATVLVVDAAFFANAEELYTALQADAAQRGGEVVGVQIFGNANMVPSFTVEYKAQYMGLSGIEMHEAGSFLTDLFYSNFNNDPARIANGYNVMDHFAEGWDVDLVPQWPVARLPLAKGEFAAFFEKYNQFVLDTGLERPDLVHFSNPGFRTTDPFDDMGELLNRMNREYKILDIPYRLYGNLLGQYPVKNQVLGGFTAENLSKENDAGIVEFMINTHGQWNNIDKCYFINDEEIRESLVNMDTINSVLDGNAYYLNCSTCSTGSEMYDNITITALNGQCVGVFSATTIISYNGVTTRVSVEEMKRSNFYYFHYSYFKALHEGATRSQAFFLAQQEYAKAVIAHGKNGIRNIEEGSYQFNLCNLLAYHNFGVLEPDVAVVAMTQHDGYIAQAGQSVPRGDHITNGKPVGTSVNIKYSGGDGLKTGTLEIHSLTSQKLDNGYIRFTMECTATAGMSLFVFNPPDGDVIRLSGGRTTGERQTIIFDIPAEDVQSAGELAMSFNFSDDDRTFIFFNTVGIS